MKTPENDDRFSHFAELHDYLKETFPLVCVFHSKRRRIAALTGPISTHTDMSSSSSKRSRRTVCYTHGKVQIRLSSLWCVLSCSSSSHRKLTRASAVMQVLMAHQDVVPVNPSTVDQWTYPPFSAHQDKDGWIWGRGVADCKNTVSYSCFVLVVPLADPQIGSTAHRNLGCSGTTRRRRL